MSGEQLSLDLRERIIISSSDLDRMHICNGLNEFMKERYHQRIYELHTSEQVRIWYRKWVGPSFKKQLSQRELSLYIGILASIFTSQKKLQGRHGEKFKAFYEEHSKVGQEYLDVSDLEIKISKRYLKSIIH